MMYSHRAAAQYQNVRKVGLVADATPTRLVQMVFEQIVASLATAQGCMQRIRDNLPLNDVIAKGKAIGVAVRLIAHLDETLDMERGGAVARNLRELYGYMLRRLTEANIANDAAIVGEVAGLVAKIKSSWDQLVKDGW